MPTENCVRVTGERAFFAASNSRDGFHSYYEPCFRARTARLFCVKGGPGTGKSTLMRRVAEAALRQGYTAEYWYCSSDADSLDGVLLFGRAPEDSFGLIDATAPHTFEPTLPGVREEILDLGAFWDAAQLRAHTEEILRLNAQKAEGYRRAYRYLAAAGEMADEMRERVAPCVDMPRLCRLAQRLLRGMESEPDAARRYGLMDSLGMRGRVRLGTFLRERRVCLIEDTYDSAYFLTAELCRLAKERGIGRVVSCHPVVPDRVDGLLLPGNHTAFVVCEATARARCEAALYAGAAHRVLPMRRFLRREALLPLRETLRQTAKLRESLMEGAENAFRDVAEAHFALEKIYTAAMNFPAEQAFAEQLCERLLAPH